MSDVPIFVQMSLPAILHLNNAHISAAEFLKDTKEVKLNLLSSAELPQQRSDETEFRSKDNIEISTVTLLSFN